MRQIQFYSFFNDCYKKLELNNFNRSIIWTYGHLLFWSKSFQHCIRHVAPRAVFTFLLWKSWYFQVWKYFWLSVSIYLWKLRLLRSLSLTNLMIITRSFLPKCLGLLIPWVLSKLFAVISRSKLLFRISIMISLVASPDYYAISCTRTQFLVKYCSCWCAVSSQICTLIDNESASVFKFSRFFSFLTTVFFILFKFIGKRAYRVS